MRETNCVEQQGLQMHHAGNFDLLLKHFSRHSSTSLSFYLFCIFFLFQYIFSVYIFSPSILYWLILSLSLSLACLLLKKKDRFNFTNYYFSSSQKNTEHRHLPTLIQMKYQLMVKKFLTRLDYWFCLT